MVSSDAVVEALIEAGVIPADPSGLRRVVIDLQAGHAAVIHTESFAGARLLEVTPALAGAEIRRAQ